MTRGLFGQGCSERTYPLMSRIQIEHLIADGRKIVIVGQYVLKLDAWLAFHPGGAKAILHVVGRDATDEVNGYHSIETRKTMERYRIGRIEGHWMNFLPPIQGGSFQQSSDTRGCLNAAAIKPSETLGAAKACNSSSTASSRSASPPLIFDVPEADGGGATNLLDAAHRRRGAAGARSSSLGTLASSADDEVHQSDIKDGHAREQHGNNDVQLSTTAFLDAKTREEINLDLDRYPALDEATQRNIVLKYRELQEKITDAGLFECNFTAYAWEVARYTLLFVMMLVLLRLKWYAASGFCLGSFWHQLVFTAHDAGHIGITHNYQVDTVIGIVIADFLGGLSLCWWKDNHNVHHIVTNSPEHDPDIEHMPFFAISHRFLQSLRSTYYERIMEYDAASRFFLSFQSWSYYVILCFGRFNLYRLSWAYIILGRGPRRGPARWHRWLEAAGQLFFWAWFGYGVVYKGIDSNWGRFVFVMVSHVVTMPLHVQITLSHFAMSTADLGPHESFPQRMLRTTMDVDCPRWLDFFHGGLQFQAIHHLYPRMPRHNLRAAQRLVQNFCDEVGIPYALYGFVDGNKQVIGRLADVSRQAAILAQCRRAVAEGRA